MRWRAFFTGKLISDAGLAWDQPIPDLQSEGQPVFRSGPKTGVTPPKLLVQSNPSYTEEARNMKLQGGCLLNAILNRQGLLEQIDVARPLGVGLDDSAITAVKQWRFKPADKNGQPVAVFVQVLVEFRLR